MYRRFKTNIANCIENFGIEGFLYFEKNVKQVFNALNFKAIYIFFNMFFFLRKTLHRNLHAVQFLIYNYRVAKCDVTKIKICELIGFVEIIL